MPCLVFCASTCLHSTCSSLGGIFSSHCRCLTSCTRVSLPAVLSTTVDNQRLAESKNVSLVSFELKRVSSSGTIKEAESTFFFFQSSSPPPTLGLKVSIVRETHVSVDGWGQGIGELSQASTEIQMLLLCLCCANLDLTHIYSNK